jgi:hypothetical protein
MLNLATPFLFAHRRTPFLGKAASELNGFPFGTVNGDWKRLNLSTQSTALLANGLLGKSGLMGGFFEDFRPLLNGEEV